MTLALGVFGWTFAAQAANDSLFSQQWGLAKIQAEQAWSVSRGTGVKVAVIDTGVDFGQPDLAGKAEGSFNCIKDSERVDDPCDPAPDGDDNGHGTEIAGIIAASEGNSVGISGVAPGARIMSLKALGEDGSGDLSSVLRSINFAADNGARVINLSLGPEVNLINDLLGLLLGGGNPKQEFQQAFDHAASQGALVVAAAGNSGTSSFFAGLQNVFVVGSTGPGDEVAFYSSSGAEIFAPGGNSSGACTPANCILTTSPRGYTAVQGTSFAAPHAAGVAALLAAKGISGSEARSKIIQTADPIPGGRRVNAAMAVGGQSAEQRPGALPAPSAPARRAATPGQSKPTVAPAASPPPPAADPSPGPLPVLQLKGSGPAVHPNDSQLTTAQGQRKPVPKAWVVVSVALAATIAIGHSLYFILRRHRI